MYFLTSFSYILFWFFFTSPGSHIHIQNDPMSYVISLLYFSV